MTERFYTCRRGWEEVLRAELTRTFPSSEHHVLRPGWLASTLITTDAAAACQLAFADQCLPNPLSLPIPSIRKGAEAIGGALVAALREHEGPWRLHIFSVWQADEEVPRRRGRRKSEPQPDASDKEGQAGPRRIALLGRELDDYLKRKQRRLLRTRIADPPPVFQADEWLVQVGLLTATEGCLSVCPSAELARLQPVVSPFAGGIVSVPSDADAPSQAYQKLSEALIRMNWRIEAGSTCIDLGASPGGWSYVALEQGAYVTSVDRSPLRPDLMQNPRLDFQKKDAFGFEPKLPADWLLCDVIAFPQRTLEMLRQWFENRWCHRFVVTIKFRGGDEYPILEEFKALLRDRCSESMLRRLSANKNEVTAVGRVGGQ
jgi:23S rRNA (cytidine2498-2'-O)-methyltransferase